MLFLLTGVSILLAVVAFTTPIYFSATQSRFLIGLLASVVTVSLVTFIFAWWDNISVDLEALSLGVNLDGANTMERLQNVLPEDRDYAEDLVFSPRKMGIGWPLKAAFAMSVTVPYALICFSGIRVIRRMRAKRKGAGA